MHTNTLKKLALALTFWLLVHYAPLKAQLTGPDFEVDTYGTITDTGTFGGTGTLSLSGTGTRMFWFPAKAAFRAGYAQVTRWDSSNIGNYSVAFGYATRASGRCSVAFGYESSADGDYATAIGCGVSASGAYSLAMGQQNSASGYTSSAIGGGAFATGSYSVAMGGGTTASGYCSTAMGFGTTASAYDSFAVGTFNLGLSSTGAAPNPSAWVSTDPLFEVGNGNGGSASNGYTPMKSDAFVVYKNGSAVLQGSLKVAPSGDIPMYTGN